MALPKRPSPRKLVELSLGAVDRIVSRRAPAPEKQKAVLLNLLRKAKKTDFGKKYGFADILEDADPVAAFRQKVPLHDYNKMYDEWWHRTLAGEKNVAWRGETTYFALSSGTSNASTKYIPVTKAAFRSMKRSALRMFLAFSHYGIEDQAYLKGWLAIGGTSQLQQEGRRHIGYLSGINADRQPSWAKGFYKPGRQIAQIADFDDRLSAIAEKAPQWDIGALIGIPHWVQLTLEEIIERHQLNNISEIWPNLQLFVSGGVSLDPYRKTLDRLVGRPMKYMNTYIASEGMIAFQHDPDMQGMNLLLNNGIFFEFIPFTDDHFDPEGNLREHAQTLGITEVQTGVDYALIMSTNSGAWRYMIGDTVRFIDLYRQEIIVSGRTKHFLNLVTEHVTVDNMNAAVQAAEEQLDIRIPEFTIAGLKVNDRFAHRWYVGTLEQVDVVQLRDILDQALGKVNEDYQSERKTALNIEVRVLPADVFTEWLKATGKANGQSKIPRVMRGEQFVQWEKFAQEQVYGSAE